MVSDAGSEIEKLLLESNDSFESPVFVVNKRIQQNLNVEDLENNSDEEEDWNPREDDEDDIFACVECDYTNKNESRLRDHMKEHMTKSNPKKKAVPSKSSTSKKLKEVSNSELTCDQCKKEFSRKDSLKRHIKTHY